MTYETMAEFHDLFMQKAWERIGPTVRATFAGLGADDVVADLGAGTGLGTLTMAGATPARIWAVEPSATMRAVLLHRLADIPDVARRVSVLAGAVPAALAELPQPVAGVLATHMVGHLSAIERSSFFSWLNAQLSEDGVALLTHQTPDLGEADAVDEIIERTHIGEHTYQATYRGTDSRFRTRYDVLDDAGRVLRSLEASGQWTVVTLDQLAAEAAAHGLHCWAGDVEGVCFVRR